MSDPIEPFEIRVDDAVLDDLHDRLARARIADGATVDGWEQGTPPGYLADLVAYWRDEYDWRAEEARLNALDHFRTTIDGQTIHFVHARSPHADATPLLLVHGWPGSIVEFLDVIPRLTRPEDHRGEVADAFHVVVPSLPGYGFSPPPTEPGWNPTRIAEAFAVLMARLGYARYGAQGGDWGAQVITRLGALDAAHCSALHLNMPLGDQPAEPVGLTDAEKADLAALGHVQREESGYAIEQGTKPQTLGAGLNDSPAGLLAWIVEKFHGWSDCDGDPLTVFTRDQMLTNVMLYWVTGTITSSFRLYREARLAGWSDGAERIEIPTGVARYPKEILRYPRSWVEQRYNVTRWVDLPRGGHFAAMEQPELFADDVRSFFRSVDMTIPD